MDDGLEDDEEGLEDAAIDASIWLFFLRMSSRKLFTSWSAAGLDEEDGGPR